MGGGAVGVTSSTLNSTWYLKLQLENVLIEQPISWVAKAAGGE